MHTHPVDNLMNAPATRNGIRYYVVRTAFHGGGVVSQHRCLAAAYRSADKHSRGECTCGCCDVIPASSFRDLSWAADTPDPYTLAQ